MNQLTSSKRVKTIATTTMRTKEAALVATFGLAILAPYAGHAEQPPPPCQSVVHASSKTSPLLRVPRPLGKGNPTGPSAVGPVARVVRPTVPEPESAPDRFPSEGIPIPNDDRAARPTVFGRDVRFWPHRGPGIDSDLGGMAERTKATVLKYVLAQVSCRNSWVYRLTSHCLET